MEFVLHVISEQTLTEVTEYIMWQDMTDTGRKEIKIPQLLEKPMVRYASLELAENRKDEQQITDLEKEENSTDTDFLIFSSVLSAQILQQSGSKVVLQAATTIFIRASVREQCRAVACILLKAVPFIAPTHDKDPACFKLQVTSATRGPYFILYSPLDLHYHCSKQLNKEKKAHILKHTCKN